MSFHADASRARHSTENALAIAGRAMPPRRAGDDLAFQIIIGQRGRRCARSLNIASQRGRQPFMMKRLAAIQCRRIKYHRQPAVTHEH